MRIGVSISTYSDENTPVGRYDLIEECLSSLEQNMPDNVYINVVSDGMTSIHRKLIKKYPFELIKRPYNGGISKVKNTGIRSILDVGCDIGFLCDDDLIFKDKKIFHKYAEAIDKTGIPHYCLFLEDNGDNCKYIDYNGFRIKKTPWVNGCFLTFTRQLIEDIGYFKVLPYKYGHEHSNFTRRVVHHGKNPYYCDIPNSLELVEINKKSLNGNKSLSNIDEEKFKENLHKSTQNLDEYVSLDE